MIILTLAVPIFKAILLEVGESQFVFFLITNITTQNLV